ncbi:MAG: endonuclease V [Pseudomonadota bacterium]
MIVCIDAAYSDTASAAAGVVAKSWSHGEPHDTIIVRSATSADYEPGAFYKRELPLLEAVMACMSFRPATVVIDGYVWLGRDGQMGLGAHLHKALENAVPVVGIAKSAFAHDDWSRPVLRGVSKRPLFVTAVGMACDAAATLVAGMHGASRLPTLVQAADRAARAAITTR